MPISDNSVWLISGIPGAGKTTISREIAQKFSHSAHIEVDRIREMIASGYVAPGEAPIAESNQQLQLGARNAALLANSFIDAGFVPILDDVILQLQLACYQDLLSHWPIRLVVLAPSVEVAIRRDQGRSEKHLGERFAYLDSELRQQMQGFGLWLDTSGLSVAQTIELIVRRADDAVVSWPSSRG